jgi:hypothetical protein
MRTIWKNENGTVTYDAIKELDKYKKGFNILMEYWDYLPDVEYKEEAHKRLKEVGL